MKSWLAVLCTLTLATTAAAADLYVSATTGSNSNAGTREQPLKNIEKALKKSKAGDTIHVAEGNYFGLRGKGYLEVPAPVTLRGGYTTDFAQRDVLAHPTLIQPSNASAKKSRKALVTLAKSKKGEHFTLDGFVLDMGQRNSYHQSEGQPEGVETAMLLLPPAYNKAAGDNPTVTEQCLHIKTTAAAGDVTVQNNVFVNCAKFAIQGGHKQGAFKIHNNVFVANRMAAIEVFGTGGKKGPRGPTAKDGEVEIDHNTILFSWSRTKDFKDMGYGVRIMTKLGYDIHHNIFGGNVITGVDHTRFNKNEWIKLDHNVFFVNKQGDLLLSEPGNVQMERVEVGDLGDLELASATGNNGQAPKLPVDQAYLAGFLSARYSEKADFDRNSPANQLRAVFGLNLQGKLTTKVSMYANRYPWKKALELFGAVPGMGAQKPE